MMKKLLSTAAVAALSAGLFAAPVGADPVNSPNSDIVELECDNGQTYEVVVSGGGEFTPGHVVGSNAMLIPVAFGPITFTAVPSGDTAIVEPPSTKGQSGKNRDLTTCSFQFGFPVGPEEIEEFGLPEGTTSVQGEGTVTVFITPARR